MRANLLSLGSEGARSILKAARLFLGAPVFDRAHNQVGGRLRRTIALGLAFSGFFVIALGEPGSDAIGKFLKSKVTAVLADPLALFAARSPGQRPSGALLLTKENAKPRERVLSTVREREPISDFDPVAETPSISDVMADKALPGQTLFVGQNTVGPPMLSQLAYAGRIFPTTFSPDAPASIEQSAGDLTADNPDGGSIDIPEPHTWMLMTFGLLALAMAGSRRSRIARRLPSAAYGLTADPPS